MFAFACSSELEDEVDGLDISMPMSRPIRAGQPSDPSILKSSNAGAYSDAGCIPLTFRPDNERGGGFGVAMTPERPHSEAARRFMDKDRWIS